jgi:hypothetical protein
MAEGKDAPDDGWKSHFDKTAKWCIDRFKFPPCGVDAATKHLHAGLRRLEAKLANETWSVDDISALDSLLGDVSEYLHKRKEKTALDLDHIKSVENELRTSFTNIYSAVADRIASEPGNAEAIALFNEMSDTMEDNPRGRHASMCQGRNKLHALYTDGNATKPPFDQIMAAIAQATDGEYMPSPLKHLFRAAEKMYMKPSRDPNLGRSDTVYDIVRCMVVYDTMNGMASGIRALQASKDAKILRVKNRFSSPTAGGWMDVMVNIEVVGDRSQHVCEAQFVHKSLYAVRKLMGGHDEYIVYRSAAELLEVEAADAANGN